MHSFALTLAATLFFGAVTSALPIDIPTAVTDVANGSAAKNLIDELAARSVGDVVNDVTTNVVDVQSVAAIFSDAQSQLEPLVQKIGTCFISIIVDVID